MKFTSCLQALLAAGFAAPLAMAQSPAPEASPAPTASHGLISRLELGIHAGLGLAGSPSFASGETNQGELQKGENKLGYLLRLDATHEVTTFLNGQLHVSIAPGLQFQKKSYKGKAASYYLDPDDLIVKVGPAGTLSASYLGIVAPALFEYQLPYASPFLSAGFAFEYLLNASYKLAVNSKEIDVHEELAHPFSLLLGLGADVPLPRGTLRCELRYAMAVNANKKVHVKTSSVRPYPWDFTIPEHRHSTLAATLGYTLPLQTFGL